MIACFPLQKMQDKYTVSMMKARASTLPQSESVSCTHRCGSETTEYSTVFHSYTFFPSHLPLDFVLRDSITSQISTSSSLPVVTPRDRRDAATLPCNLSRSVPLVPEWLENSFYLFMNKSSKIFLFFVQFVWFGCPGLQRAQRETVTPPPGDLMANQRSSSKTWNLPHPQTHPWLKVNMISFSQVTVMKPWTFKYLVCLLSIES